MARGRHLADGIILRITCPHCAKQIRQTLSWFVDKGSVPCGGCGQAIELNRVRIDKRLRDAARAQAAIGPALTRVGKELRLDELRLLTTPDPSHVEGDAAEKD